MNKKIRYIPILLLIFFISPGYSLGENENEPEVVSYGGVAKDDTLIAVGIADPTPFGSGSFIGLDDPYIGTVYDNELWVYLYPPTTDKEELFLNLQCWRQKEKRIEREYKDGTKEITYETIIFDKESKNISIPVKHDVYMESFKITTHKNLTNCNISYLDIKWTFTHLSTPASEPVKSVRNRGDVFEIYLKGVILTLIVAFAAFMTGKSIFQRVRYVPELTGFQLARFSFIMWVLFQSSYMWIEYHTLSIGWYWIEIPVFIIFTFLSLQFFKSNEIDLLALSVYNEGEVELGTAYPLIIREKIGDEGVKDLLVSKYRWSDVLCRLFKPGPYLQYEGAKSYSIKDRRKNFNEIIMMQNEFPPVFLYPKIVWNTDLFDTWPKKIFSTLMGFILAFSWIYLITNTTGWLELGIIIGGLIFFHSLTHKIQEGTAIIFLSEIYEADKLKILAYLAAIQDNNEARRKVETKYYNLLPKVNSMAAEQAFEMFSATMAEYEGRSAVLESEISDELEKPLPDETKDSDPEKKEQKE